MDFGVEDLRFGCCHQRETCRACPAPGLGFEVWDLRFRVKGLGFEVWGSGFGVEGLGLEVWASRFRSCGLRRTTEGVEFQV